MFETEEFVQLCGSGILDFICGFHNFPSHILTDLTPLLILLSKLIRLI